MKTMTIAAEVHSDDHAIRSSFDAVAWFRTADAGAVASLAREDWSGCREADDVARAAEDAEPGVQGVLDYVRNIPGIGFECSVNGTQALSWLKENRPEVFAEVCAKADLDPADYEDVKSAPRM